MDINDIRGYLTPALGIVLFVWIVMWAYGKKSRQVYDEAANLPFADDEDDSASVQAVVADQRKMI
ncbi:MAG: cbb3-type cytochrome c oxidase subunit 3 [Zoogloeaceae bacterium]|jgi:cytochrome c oxidase cbb3-type subunit 4|nr:cbb3-type cytochrome c oxidase subunit 3 [Zoogloeaceae bacterium]